MNESDQNHDPATIAELHDRLMDRALAETIGRETPPDLSARILAGQPKCTAVVHRRWPRAWRGALLAVAATLLVAIPIYLTQQAWLQQAEFRSASVSITKSDQYSPQLRPSNDAISLRGQIEEAGGPWQSGKVRERGNAIVQADELAGKQLVAEGENVQFVPFMGTRVLTSEAAPAAGQPAESPPQEESSWWIGHQKSQLMSDESFDVDRYAAAGESTRSLTRREWTQLDENRRKYSLSDLDAEAQAAGKPVTPRIIIQEGEERLLQVDQLDETTGLGTGPGSPGDQYSRIYENPFIQAVGGDAVSTFSIDVDTASYANVRQFLMDMRQLPPPDAVRIEELVNYFDYDYAGPNSEDEAPFAAHVEVAGCPWAPSHRLVRIGVKGREIKRDKRPPSNLVFLVDVSGSMDEPNKLPLVVDGLRQLTRELGENDRVAIVVYASSEGLALESTRGDNQAAILGALDRLRAGGSTAGGAGIQLAYQIAEDHFIRGGTNRVVLCTDGDFNVGVTSTAELERLVTQKAKDTGVFLSVLGFGRGNLNDAMMQTIADRGNGNHHYVDNLREARKVLVEEMTGTLITIAKDVKIQVEFNPAQVAGYRLLGYENRMLRTEDFNDDTKDAGEIGAGHTVTALYEVIPAGKPVGLPAADELKYQPSMKPQEGAVVAYTSGELLTLKMRYKEPAGDTSRKLEWPMTDADAAFSDASDDFQFAAAVASFGLLLRDSQFKGDATYDAVGEIAGSSLGSDPHGYRAEFVEIVRRAKELQAGR